MSYGNIGETRRPGRIEVVCGSMFSGKTEELIRRLRRAKFAHEYGSKEYALLVGVGG